MDVVLKRSFELSTWTASMPQVVVRKGEAVTTTDGKVCKALYPLRLLPFTVHAVQKQVNAFVDDEVRAFRRCILDFTRTMHAFLKFPDVESTATSIWPVLFPGFDGSTDGTIATLFEPAASLLCEATLSASTTTSK